MAEQNRLREFLGPRYWPSWIGLMCMRLLAFLPLPAIALVGGALGELLFYFMPGRRHVTLTNLRACFPELSPRQQRRLARAHFRAMVQSALAVPIMWWGTDARLKRLVTRRGEEHLQQALAQRRAVILMFAHFVAMEMGFTLSRDYPTVTVYKRARNRLIDTLARQRRARFTAKLIERSEGIKPAIRAIQQGRIFVYLTDQDQGRTGAVFAPFFGIPAITVSGIGRVAALTDALVIPCFIRMLPWGRGFEIAFQPPLNNYPTDDAVADTTHMNKIIEEAVREMPEQYFWSHRRFKTRPEGEGPFY